MVGAKTTRIAADLKTDGKLIAIFPEDHAQNRYDEVLNPDFSIENSRFVAC